MIGSVSAPMSRDSIGSLCYCLLKWVTIEMQRYNCRSGLLFGSALVWEDVLRTTLPVNECRARGS
jgi:hypothetical protein